MNKLSRSPSAEDFPLLASGQFPPSLRNWKVFAQLLRTVPDKQTPPPV